MQAEGPFLMVGLGNPGPRYRETRHNVGHRCIDRLAREQGLPLKTRHPMALWGQGEVAGVPVVLAKSRTFMNLSGEAVSFLVQRFHAGPERLLLVYDDLDLPLGKIRLRPRGSAGGHKGMASVIQALATDSFPRLRIGIGPLPPGVEAAAYVLSPFPPEERPRVEEALGRATQAIICLLKEGMEAAMNRYN